MKFIEPNKKVDKKNQNSKAIKLPSIKEENEKLDTPYKYKDKVLKNEHDYSLNEGIIGSSGGDLKNIADIINKKACV
jgi:hypothetical protein